MSSTERIKSRHPFAAGDLLQWTDHTQLLDGNGYTKRRYVGLYLRDAKPLEGNWAIKDIIVLVEGQQVQWPSFQCRLVL